MPNEVGGPIATPKPAQVSEEDAAAYARQQAIKSGAIDLVNPMGAVTIGVKAGRTFLSRLVGRPVGEQTTVLVTRLQELNATLDKIATFAGRDLVPRPGVSPEVFKQVMEEHQVIRSALRKIQLGRP